MHIYDYIIIGGGLTGLSIAKKISAETSNLLILESQDSIGGANKGAHLLGKKIENGLRFLPATPAAYKCLNFLNSTLTNNLVTEEVQNLVQTYEASGFKEFVGFGENSPDFYEQLSYFLSPTEIKTDQHPSDWVRNLEESLVPLIQKKSVVTRFGFEGLDSENPHLTHVVVNGAKNFYAKNFIFTGDPKDLRLLLPDDVFNPRNKAKLKKVKTWQAVCVDFFHENALPNSNMFLLDGTTDDQVGPCIGRFLPATNSGQISQWLSFVDSDLAEDTENIAIIIKKIKRQFKRAFPDISQNMKSERIFVTSPLSNVELKLAANSTFPKIENLWVASSQLSSYPNLIGSLMQAQLVLSSMGFGQTYDQALFKKESSEANTHIY